MNEYLQWFTKMGFVIQAAAFVLLYLCLVWHALYSYAHDDDDDDAQMHCTKAIS